MQGNYQDFNDYNHSNAQWQQAIEKASFHELTHRLDTLENTYQNASEHDEGGIATQVKVAINKIRQEMSTRSGWAAWKKQEDRDNSALSQNQFTPEYLRLQSSLWQQAPQTSFPSFDSRCNDDSWRTKASFQELEGRVDFLENQMLIAKQHDFGDAELSSEQHKLFREMRKRMNEASAQLSSSSSSSSTQLKM